MLKETHGQKEGKRDRTCKGDEQENGIKIKERTKKKKEKKEESCRERLWGRKKEKERGFRRGMNKK